MESKQGRIIPFERDVDFFIRRGSTRLERNDLIEAINNYYIAQEREPGNVDIQLAIAEILTEMHRYEQSNRLLFPLLSMEESPAECFFGIACNFLGMQEFEHAHDSLESYLTLEPDGEFVADALDMLDVIEDESLLYTMPGVYLKDEREAHSACALSRQYLENGRPDDAVKLLEDTAKKYSYLHFVSNNLALAHFCAKNYKKATEIVNDVLAENPNDVQAHCNLLLFRHAARDEEGTLQTLNFLRNAATDDPQDRNRMAVVFMEMGKMDEALIILKKLQSLFPYDEGTLHRLGVCYYHLGKYSKAVSCYDRLMKIDPYDTVASYYRRIAWLALKDRMEKIDWMYNYQVPYAELLRRVRELNQLNHHPSEELKRRWRTEKAFRGLIIWSLKLPDHSTKRSILQMIASFGGREAEQALRRFQLDQTQPDTVKKEVFSLLKHMGAKEPYIAYLHGNLVQSRVQLRRASFDGARLPVTYQRALETCIKTMQGQKKTQGMIKAVELFSQYVDTCGNLPKLRGAQVYAFAGALEFLASRDMGTKLTKAQIASLYGVSLTRLNNAIEKIRSVTLEERNT